MFSLSLVKLHQVYQHLAVYNTHLFAQIFEGKNKDAYYTWAVLIPYLHQCFRFFYLRLCVKSEL